MMLKNRFFQTIVVAGLVLLLALPIGTYVGVNTSLFTGIFIVHLTLLVAALFFGGKELASLFRDGNDYQKSAIFLGSLTLTIAFLESRLPVTFRDALIHHLSVPRWWLEQGSIVSPSWHEWSFYPMLINLGFAGLMTLGLDSWVASYHWIYGALFCVAMAHGAHHTLKNKNAAVIAFLLAATTPIIFRLSSLPIVDCGLALYSAIAFFALLSTLTSSDSDEQHRDSHLTWAGLALGLALGSKYNALPFALSLMLFYILISARLKNRRVFKAIGIVCLSAAIVYAPWLVRNYELTNNPIYPLYSNIFKPSIERPAGLPNLKPIEQRRLIYQETPLEIALLPLRIFFEGIDDQPARFDGVLSPLFALTFFGFIYFERKRIFSFSFGVAAFYLLLTIFLNPLRVRYLAPILAPLLLMTSEGLRIALSEGKGLRIMGSLALGVHLFLFGEYAFQKVRREELIAYLMGRVTNEAYLRDRIPEYPVIEYINQHLSTDRKIYLLFTGNRFALYKPQTFSGGHYSASVLVEWIRASERSGKPLTQFFHEAEIDFILSDSLRAQQFVLEQLNDAERKVWGSFVTAHLKFVHQERGFSLWQVINE